MDGQVVRVTAWGITAATGSTKQIKAYFGATSVDLFPAVVLDGTVWEAEFRIIRTGATAQIIKCWFDSYDTSSGANQTYQAVEVTPAETLSCAVTIKLTGATTTTDDIVQKGMIVELLT